MLGKLYNQPHSCLLGKESLGANISVTKLSPLSLYDRSITSRTISRGVNTGSGSQTVLVQSIRNEGQGQGDRQNAPQVEQQPEGGDEGGRGIRASSLPCPSPSLASTNLGRPQAQDLLETIFPDLAINFLTPFHYTFLKRVTPNGLTPVDYYTARYFSDSSTMHRYELPKVPKILDSSFFDELLSYTSATTTTIAQSSTSSSTASSTST